MYGNNKHISLRLFQANVDKCEPAHHAALQLAYEKDFNVVLLQEPHSSYDEKKDICRVPDHPGFTCFSPVPYWNSRVTRPRVLTYARKHRKKQPEQLTVVLSRDLLWVAVNGITILNVYNDPQVTETITAITQWNVPLGTIVAGDMNAHHLHWGTDRPSSRCVTKLAEWAEEQLKTLNQFCLARMGTSDANIFKQKRRVSSVVAFGEIFSSTRPSTSSHKFSSSSSTSLRASSINFAWPPSCFVFSSCSRADMTRQESRSEC